MTITKRIDAELCMAAADGNAERVDCALLKGADPCAMFDGRTALQWAMRFTRPTCIKILSRVSDFGLPDKDGVTAFQHACALGLSDIVKRAMTPELCEHQDKRGFTALVHAGLNGRKEVVELILPLSDLDAKDNLGWKPEMAISARLADVFDDDAHHASVKQIRAFREAVAADGLMPQIMKQISKPGMRKAR